MVARVIPNIWVVDNGFVFADLITSTPWRIFPGTWFDVTLPFEVVGVIQDIYWDESKVCGDCFTTNIYSSTVALMVASLILL